MSKRLFVEDAEENPAVAPPLPTAIAQDAPARPKVMRRPPQFSQPNTLTPIEPMQQLVVMAPSTSRANAAIAWQEDVFFGLVLIASLAIINLMLVIVVPHLPAVRINEDHTSSIVFGNALMPQPVKNADSNITLYADPEAERREHFDLNRVDPEQNALSISPKDIPAPRARALDNGGQ